MSENGKLASYGNKPGDYSTDVLAQKAYDFSREIEDDDISIYIPKKMNETYK